MPACGAVMSEIEIEVGALRYFVTRLAAEVISLHPAPAKKLSELRDEYKALGVESVKRIDEPGGQKMLAICVELNSLIDETAGHIS
jgi:hypothetical protein